MGVREELPLHGGLDCVEFWRALHHLAGQPGPSIVKSPSHGGPGWAEPQLEAPCMADQAKSEGVCPRSHQFAWCRPGSTYCRDSIDLFYPLGDFLGTTFCLAFYIWCWYYFILTLIRKAGASMVSEILNTWNINWAEVKNFDTMYQNYIMLSVFIKSVVLGDFSIINTGHIPDFWDLFTLSWATRVNKDPPLLKVTPLPPGLTHRFSLFLAGNGTLHSSSEHLELESCKSTPWR